MMLLNHHLRIKILIPLVSGGIEHPKHLSLLYINKKTEKAHYFETSKEKDDEPFLKYL